MKTSSERPKRRDPHQSDNTMKQMIKQTYHYKPWWTTTSFITLNSTLFFTPENKRNVEWCQIKWQSNFVQHLKFQHHPILFHRLAKHIYLTGRIQQCLTFLDENVAVPVPHIGYPLDYALWSSFQLNKVIHRNWHIMYGGWKQKFS